jgi:PTH1 family peptidyl-tRNA hydrolase
MDLPVGRIRIRPEGSSGGHKGIESIIYQLSTEKFPRIRIGIGRPEDERNTTGHVLGNFCGEELEKIRLILTEVCKAALSIIEDGINEAMNQFNGFEI